MKKMYLKLTLAVILTAIMCVGTVCSAYGQLPSGELWREDLVNNVVGFGKNTTGGKGGDLCQVTNLNDSGPGSLRACAEAVGAKWITFTVSGTITLTSEILIKSNKTIDGRGQNIVIANRGFMIGTWSPPGGPLNPGSNVIIHNISMKNVNGSNMIVISEDASNVWVDHNTFQNAADEIIYVSSNGSDGILRAPPKDVTISWNHFPPTTPGQGWADKSLLFSDPSLPEDAATNITLHHNHYQTYVRHPEAKWVTMHAFNNYYNKTSIGAQIASDGKFYSENEIFEALYANPYPAVEPDPYAGSVQYPLGPAANVKVLFPWLIGGAWVKERNPSTIFSPSSFYSYTADIANAALQTNIINNAGRQNVASPPPPTSGTLTVSPTSVAPGGSVTVTWSGIATPTATDWIGLYTPSASNTTFIDYIYVSCSQTPGAASASGSCSFVVPATVAPGTYEMRLLANDGYILLAKSGMITVDTTPPTVTVSCPSSTIISTDKGSCDAIVNNIDPVLQGGSTQINYTLSGATFESGTGSVSGKRFNKGVTTVTYSLANDASKNCSFTVTVNDKEPPSITNITADPASLWPPNHKMQKVTISYDVKDNCGFNSPTLSVSSNETNNGNNADWIVVDNHHIQLRAEKGARGTERIYTITIRVTDLSGNKSIKTINISVSKNKVKTNLSGANRSAITEEEDAQSLIIIATPNPSLNYFTLLTKSNSDKPINVRVTDVLGRVIETRVNIAANGKLQLGSNYRQGIYFVEVVQGTQRQLAKLIKQ